MDMIPINWQLIGNPYNWAIVVLMVLIGAFALHTVSPQLFPFTTNKGN